MVSLVAVSNIIPSPEEVIEKMIESNQDSIESHLNAIKQLLLKHTNKYAASLYKISEHENEDVIGALINVLKIKGWSARIVKREDGKYLQISISVGKWDVREGSR